MQALGKFISLIPSFDGDIPILVILILTGPPGDESRSDPSVGANASTLKTQVGKRKATVNLTPQKKAKKNTGRSAGRNKINEPALKTSASTPPSGPRRKIPIQRSKRYARHEYVSSLTFFFICEPLCRVP
jgi:hypothetical protein